MFPRLMSSMKGVISNYFWERAAKSIIEKIKSVEFIFGARLCHDERNYEQLFF